MTEDTPPKPSLSPFVAKDAHMLDSVMTQLSGMEDLSPTRCRDLKSALNSLARMIGRSPAEIPANIHWLYIRVRKIIPAQHNITKKRLANIKSDALKALELTGCSRKRSDWLAPVSPGWSDLLGKIENKQDLWKLTQLAQFCSALSVEPQQVTEQHPLDLLKTLIAESFVNRPEHVVSNAIKTWNRLKGEVSCWPDVVLSPLPRKKDPWTSPIEAFPDSFQSDVNAWLERLRNPDLFDGSGPSKPLRPSTIAHRRFQIQEVASALMRSGKPVPEITSLAVLVEMTNLKAALRWLTFLITSGHFQAHLAPEDRVTQEAVSAYIDQLTLEVASWTVWGRLAELLAVCKATAPSTDWSWLNRAVRRPEARGQNSKDKHARLRPASQIAAWAYRGGRGARHRSAYRLHNVWRWSTRFRPFRTHEAGGTQGAHARAAETGRNFTGRGFSSELC